MSKRQKFLLVSLILIGFAARLGLIVAAGNQVRPFWSGGGDSYAYVLLAENITAGKGLSYAGIPTAFRPPAYPLFLAVCRHVFGARYIFWVRVLQFLAAIGAAWFCAMTSHKLWGSSGGYVTATCFSLTPTLIFLNSEILTESFAILLTSLFLYWIVSARHESRWAGAQLGGVIGASMLLRFNAVALPFVALWRLFQVFKSERLLKEAAWLCLFLSLLLSPWFARNWIVFGHKFVYSTLSGWGLVLGIYSPQGRADSEEYLQIKKTLGWEQSEIETNGRDRLKFGPEIELNRQAVRFAARGWRQAGWAVPVVLMRKLADFWLSTDQLFSISTISFIQRTLRRSGVAVYWILLLCGALGLLRLYKFDPLLANTLLWYAIVSTLLYLPFAMNTRLRVSCIEPALCILAGFLGQFRSGWVPASERESLQTPDGVR